MQKRTITLSALISTVLIVPTLAIAMPTDTNDSSLVTSDSSATSVVSAPIDRTLQEEGLEPNEQLSDEEQMVTQSAEVAETTETVTSASETDSLSQDIVDGPSVAPQELDPLPIAPIQDPQSNDTGDQTSPNTDTTDSPVTLQETRKIIVR